MGKVTFKYTYRSGESPEERLRNKLQPLFHLIVEIASNKVISGELLEACVQSVDDIINILDDIEPFYKGEDLKGRYTQDSTI